MPGIALRPRTAPEIVDAAFLLARHAYLPLATVAAVGALVSAHATIASSARTSTLPGGVRAAVWGIGMAAALIGHGAGVGLAVEAYRGRPADPAAALRVALGRAWPLLLASAYFMLMLFGGMLLLVLPAGYVLARYAVVEPVIMAEGLGARASLRRAAALSAGRRWRVLATVGIAYVAVTALVMSAQWGTLALTRSLAAATVASQAIGVLVAPFYAALLAALYFDLRVSGEGYDVETLAAELDAATPAPAA